MARKKEGSRTLVKNLLPELLPPRFAAQFCELHFKSELPLAQVADKELQARRR